MPKADRLMALLQALRRRRRPVSGAVLAEETGVSLRTLYRDIAALKAQGAGIEGEAGLGFVLRPGFLLPPLMFSQAEIEALVLGSRWVAERGDAPLAAAARDSLAKIAAVLPPDLAESLGAVPALIGPGAAVTGGLSDLSALRAAIRGERKLAIRYADAAGGETARVIWPLALAFFDRVRVVVAWCELRRDFRHFRTDRIRALEPVEGRFPRRGRVLLSEWRAQEGVKEQ